MRFESGFWSNTTLVTLEGLDVGYTMGVPMVKSVVSAVSAIAADSWTPIEYTPDGEAEVAEWTYKGRRLIVRRPRLVGRQATLWPEWRHFAFVTDLRGDPVDVDAFHWAHARIELAIKDLKEGAGMELVPSGNFNANAAWLVCAVLVHDLIRWAALLGELTSEDQLVVARTILTLILFHPRQPGKPLRTTHTASTTPMALGRVVLSGTRPAAVTATGPRVVSSPRPAHLHDDDRTALTTDEVHHLLVDHALVVCRSRIDGAPRFSAGCSRRTASTRGADRWIEA